MINEQQLRKQETMGGDCRIALYEGEISLAREIRVFTWIIPKIFATCLYCCTDERIPTLSKHS
jgi:hypothetical protein